MARTPKSNSKVPGHGDTSSRRAPSPNHTPSGDFAKGNNANPNPLPGPGVPPRRADARYWLRRALEIPESEWPKVPMCPADRIARKIARTLGGVNQRADVDQGGNPSYADKSGADEPMPELMGKDLVAAHSTALGAAYGNLVITEQADHLAGQAARDRVADLLDQAAELRKRALESRAAGRG